MSAKPSFFAELQRRHVYKVGAMYCVAGWLLVQIVTQVFPIYDISAAAQRIIVTVIVAGLPVALVLAWLFDLTPQGIVRTAEMPAAGETADAARQRRGTERRLNYLLGALLALAAAYIALEHSLPRRAATAAGDDKSIAVLPFENLSDDKANAYFAEGMQDEILTRLAKIGQLRVISRTSTQHYASSPDNLPQIAAELGVANILEGSVQKAADKVRVNVQLIRAAGDSHLWAETYDRKLDDVFGVQGEVAAAIADALGARLSGASRQEVTAAPTHDAAAYDAYLRGVALYRQGYSNAAFRSATRAFEEAVAADPGFAQAWALLSRGCSLMVFFGDDTSQQRRDAAIHALQQAERLAPDALETQSARAYYTYRVERDYEQALRQFQALHARWPNDVETLTVMSYILARQDHLDQASALVQQALLLDPRDVQLYKLQAIQDLAQRRFAAIAEPLERVRTLAPDDAEWRALLAMSLMAQGQLQEAAAQLNRAPVQVSDDYSAELELARLQRDWQPAIAWLRQLLAQPDENAVAWNWIDARVNLADLRRLSGDSGALTDYRAALELIRAAQQRDPDNPLLRAYMAQALAGIGDEAGTLAQLDLLQQRVPESRDAMDGRKWLELRARLLLRFGRVDEALTILRHLLAVPGNSIYSNAALTPAVLRLDPDFDSLRGDPRFKQLLADAEAGAGAAGP